MYKYSLLLTDYTFLEKKHSLLRLSQRLKFNSSRLKDIIALDQICLMIMLLLVKQMMCTNPSDVTRFMSTFPHVIVEANSESSVFSQKVYNIQWFYLTTEKPTNHPLSVADCSSPSSCLCLSVIRSTGSYCKQADGQTLVSFAVLSHDKP